MTNWMDEKSWTDLVCVSFGEDLLTIVHGLQGHQRELCVILTIEVGITDLELCVVDE